MLFFSFPEILKKLLNVKVCLPLNRPRSYSEKESQSNDILLQFVELSNTVKSFTELISQKHHFKSTLRNS